MTDQKIEMDRYLVVAHWTEEETPQLRFVQVFSKNPDQYFALLTLIPEEVKEMAQHLCDLWADMDSQKKVQKRRQG